MPALAWFYEPPFQPGLLISQDGDRFDGKTRTSNITTIAAWLGHAQLATTHAYVEINLRMKQKAIAAADTLPELSGATFPQDELLAWLDSLGRSGSYVQCPLPPRPPAFSRGSPLHITRGSP